MADRALEHREWAGSTEARPLALLACVLVGVSGFTSYLALPVMLGALAGAKGLGANLLGWLGSADLAGLLIGSLCTARIMNRASSVSIALVGGLTAAAAQLATVIADGFAVVALARFVAGFGGGICYALALGRLASLGNPTRDFSIFGVGLILYGSIVLAAIPWLVDHIGLAGVFGLLIAGHLVAMLFVAWLPKSNPGTSTHEPLISGAALLGPGRLALLAIFVFSIGSTIFWAYVERIATLSPEVSSIYAGFILNVANLLCLITLLAVVGLERRFGQRGAQLAFLTALGLMFLIWPIGAGRVIFAIVTTVYFQIATASQVLQQAVLGTTDPSGKQAALYPVAQGAGYALGPFIGGMLLEFGFGFRGMFIVVSLTMFAGALGFMWVYRGIAQARKRAAAE